MQNRYRSTPLTLANEDFSSEIAVDVHNNQLFSLATLEPGSNPADDVQEVLTPLTAVLVTGDNQVNPGRTYVGSITIQPNTTTPTAGSIAIYDSLTEGGTKKYEFALPNTWFAPFTIIVNSWFDTGVFVGYTTAANVNTTVTIKDSD